ncbi:hypothetical protein ACFO3U_01530 [Flavobacterium ponti]|uniref:ABC transporter permease n=1 Tax=Flavobacterium ponti TaxID=665133 RepID=A0ABV9P0J5_9FLAO
MDLKKTLPLFSYIFHPIFITFYGVLLYIWLAEVGINSLSLLLLIQVIILTIFLPLSIYYLLKATGHIKSFTEATINERKFPILLQATFLFILLKFSGFIEDLAPLYFFMLGGLIASIVAFVMTFVNFKVSLHMIGVCSLLLFITSLSISLNISIIPLIALMIVIVGNVASSRLFMKSHDATELIAGSCIGFLSQVILWQFYL